MKWIILVLIVGGLLLFNVDSDEDLIGDDQLGSLDVESNSAVLNLDFDEITNEEDCSVKGGEWMLEQGAMVPIESLEYKCFEKYTDVGKVCSDSDDCQGFCKVDSASVCYSEETNEQGQYELIPCTGFCSESWVLECNIVEDGYFIGVDCGAI